jgi:hypothetical protein
VIGDNVLGPVRQTSYVVDDVERTAAVWSEQFGIGPFFVTRLDTPVDLRGQRSHVLVDLAMAQSGAHQVELIQNLGSEPSVFGEVVPGPRSLHHVCFWTDLDRGVELLTARGCELVQTGISQRGSFVFLTSPVGPPFIELVEAAPGSRRRHIYDQMAEIAERWDGNRPFRQLKELL